jgi:hypothetical protein
MPWIGLAPSVIAAVLSRDSTPLLIVGIVNAAVSFFAINTILNLGTQQETGTEIDSFNTYKSASVGVLTITWIVAIVLIVVAIV